MARLLGGSRKADERSRHAPAEACPACLAHISAQPLAHSALSPRLVQYWIARLKAVPAWLVGPP